MVLAPPLRMSHLRHRNTPLRDHAYPAVRILISAQASTALLSTGGTHASSYKSKHQAGPSAKPGYRIEGFEAKAWMMNSTAG